MKFDVETPGGRGEFYDRVQRVQTGRTIEQIADSPGARVRRGKRSTGRYPFVERFGSRVFVFFLALVLMAGARLAMFHFGAIFDTLPEPGRGYLQTYGDVALAAALAFIVAGCFGLLRLGHAVAGVLGIMTVIWFEGSVAQAVPALWDQAFSPSYRAEVVAERDGLSIVQASIADFIVLATEDD